MAHTKSDNRTPQTVTATIGFEAKLRLSADNLKLEQEKESLLTGITKRALMRDQRQVVGDRASDYTLLSLTLHITNNPSLYTLPH